MLSCFHAFMLSCFHFELCSMFKTSTRLTKMLLLSEKDVRKCILTKDCIDINRKALASLHSGKAVVPTRLALPYEDVGSNSNKDEGAAKDWTLFKPAGYYGEDNQVSMGMKLVSIRAGNPSRGRPLVPATIMVVNAESGEAEALMGGTYLTGARTAAGSAVATELCCKRDAKRLVVFGAGLQAECHIEAIKYVQPSINHVTIVNRTSERAQLLVEKLSKDTPNIKYDIVLLNDRDALKDVVGKADVIAATTNTTTPLWNGSWLKPGCHINGVGSYTSEMQEVDEVTVNRSKVLFDTHEGLNVGDLKHLLSKPDHPKALLGKVLDDKSWLRQETAANVDCTFFKSVGTAIQDVMTAQVVLRRAEQLSLGQEVDMS